MATGRAVKSSALEVIQKSMGDCRLDLIALALKRKKVSFDKGMAMIDEMTALLKREQVDDNDSKAYCETLIDETEYKVKELELRVSDLSKAVADAKEGIATLAEEIKTLSDGIKAKDKAFAWAYASKGNTDYAQNTVGTAFDI